MDNDQRQAVKIMAWLVTLGFLAGAVVMWCLLSVDVSLR
jgi:type VI protein secretion system component VasF